MPVPQLAALSLTHLVAIRARDQPDHVAFYTGVDEPGDPLRPLTYFQVQQAVDRLCAHYASIGLTLPAITPLPQRTIAIFTSTAIDESLLEMALAKLGSSPLLLSVNNSTPAVAHLCKLTHATHLIYGSKYPDVASEAQRLLKEQGYELEIVPEMRFPLWGPDGVQEAKIPQFKPVLAPSEEAERVAVILHSSGSTGFPKPVYITHKGMIANLHGHIPQSGFSALPVYHGFGHFSGFRCFYNGVPFTLFPPHLPLTSANICRIIESSPTPCKQCFAVPYVIKLMAETEEGTRALAAFDAVSYAGAALPDDLGDRLTAAGVNILSIYGTTETGALLNSKRDFATDKSWNWLRATGLILSYMAMEPRGANTYEMVVKDGWPPKIETNRPDGSYATKDLFIRHEEKGDGNWYKYCGRLDDTLVQVLGEKTNPVPIELAIRGNSPYIAEAIVFGAGRPQVGCLILPSELGSELSKDREAFFEKVWPVIEEANAQAPTHSRLLPEMVHILPYGTEIPVATKMTILRPACYAKFKDIIDEIYDRFENGNGAAKLILSKPELEKFIFDAIAQTLGATRSAALSNKTDLFAFGVDSLQATRIRNICQKELDLGGHTLGQNIVYENPSIDKLAEYILSLRSGQDALESDEDQHAKMLAMVERWSSNFDVRKSNPSSGQRTASASHVIVLTGATGSLGAHILQRLVSSQSVSKVICLSRAKSHTESFARVQESLQLRQRHLSAAEQAKILSFAANVNEDQLGLTSMEYEILRSEATAVIHNAWPVNFVLGIDSFDEHIGGVVNLINLCLRSSQAQHPTFYSSSSVGTQQGVANRVCAEDFSDSPATASPMGYARSKWVVEKVCQRAAKDTPINVGVLRIGQLVGDTENGVWNETEAWPLLFKGANAVGALPLLSERPSWLPVDIAGRAIVEIATQPTPPKSVVYHVLNHDTTSTWDRILSGLKQAGVRFDTVSREEWLERVAKSNPDGSRNPTIKLLGFYRNRIGKADERPPMEFSVEIASKAAPSIASCPAITEDLVGRWVDHWRTTGFLSAE